MGEHRPVPSMRVHGVYNMIITCAPCIIILNEISKCSFSILETTCRVDATSTYGIHSRLKLALIMAESFLTHWVDLAHNTAW